jgi:DNA repair exonuclease SbcCD ATPase subunit
MNVDITLLQKLSTTGDLKAKELLAKYNDLQPRLVGLEKEFSDFKVGAEQKIKDTCNQKFAQLRNAIPRIQQDTQNIDVWIDIRDVCEDAIEVLGGEVE